MTSRRANTDPRPDHTHRVIRSAVWAAWADAVGFISEITDERGLWRRLGNNGPPLSAPVQWRRRVGGRFGAEAVLPAGCYSDDTQLRLAVGRAVTGGGFDVEAFARVELTVWPSYALGGGHSSKAAARNLARPDTAWFANFYDGWTNGGGNGAAMRIQPHIWAAPQPGAVAPHLGDVFIDALVTHGHPRAIFGAVLHAAALGETLASGAAPGPERWGHLIATATAALDLIDDHLEVISFWRPSWESATGTALTEAWSATAAECKDLLHLCAEEYVEPTRSLIAAGRDADEALAAQYRSLIELLGIDRDELRGSGTHTVIAALALSAAAGPHVRAAALTAARAVGSDTDTIATMTAAVSGAAAHAEPAPEDVLDRGYIVAEATRLARIAAGESTERFAYPDLLTWVAPRSQSDACGLADDRLALSGLGWCQQLQEYPPAEARESVWRWLRTDFGQTVLAKQRTELTPLPKGAWPARRVVVDAGRPAGDRVPDDAGEQRRADDRPRPRPEQRSIDDQHGVRRGELPTRTDVGDDSAMGAQLAERPPAEQRGPNPSQDDTGRPRDYQVSVDALFQWVAEREFSNDALGKAVRRLAETGTVDQVVAFCVLLHATAQHSRRGGGRTPA